MKFPEIEDYHICSECGRHILFGDPIFFDAEGIFRGSKDTIIENMIIYHLDCIILTIRDEIEEGESDQREFKASFRGYNGKKSSNLEHAIAKTICGFLNKNGGKLFIGVDDEGQTLGLEKDYNSLGGKRNRDEFNQYLCKIIRRMIGLGHNRLWKREFHRINNKEICIIEVKRSPKPVILKDNGKEYYYVREGTTTNSLPISEALTHYEENFKG